jgi:DNA repair protein RadD
MQKFILRSYQVEAVLKMLWALDLPGNDLISIAQAGGKSVIISEFARKYGKPILILQPSKEILDQNYQKILTWADENEVGIYSASFNRKEIKPITFATIQSIYKKPDDFSIFEVVIVDEAHLLPVGDKNSMYMKLFRKANTKKIFGTSATCFRQDTYYDYPGGWKNYQGKAWQKRYIESVTTTKMISRYKGGFWSRMLYVLNTSDLLEMGYLSPLKYIDKAVIRHEQLKLNKSESDFDLEYFEEITKSIYPDIGQFIKNLPHYSIIVYCSSIEQANQLSELISGSKVLTSETGSKEREKTILALKNGTLRVVFNVSVLTIGFDYPQLEAIVILRPCRSLALHLQILGRVARKAKGKEFGYVYDLVDNVRNLGKLEEIKTVKLADGWNVVSDSVPEGFHLKPLYRFRLANRKLDKRDEEET